MLTSAKALLQHFNLLLEKLNSTSIKRLVIYAMLIYPPIIIYMYREEVKLLLTNQNESAYVENIADAQKNCFRLREKYKAESVQLYIYQPLGKDKSYKELVVSSFGQIYQPLASLNRIQLVSRTKLIEDMKNQGYALVHATSGHHESALVASFNLAKMYVIPVKDITTGQIIGEAIWIFENEVDVKSTELIIDSQIFAYGIHS